MKIASIMRVYLICHGDPGVTSRRIKVTEKGI